MVTLGTWISGQQRHISMWGEGGREGGLDILLLLTLLVIFAESTIITFVELVKVMRIIAFLFGIRLIYKKLLREEVYYIIYTTLIIPTKIILGYEGLTIRKVIDQEGSRQPRYQKNINTRENSSP